MTPLLSLSPPGLAGKDDQGHLAMDVLSSLLVPLGLIDKVASHKSGLKVLALGPYQSLVDALAKFGFSPATTRVLDLVSGKKTIFSSES